MELVSPHQNVAQKVVLLTVIVLQDLEYAVHLSKYLFLINGLIHVRQVNF